MVSINYLTAAVAIISLLLMRIRFGPISLDPQDSLSVQDIPAVQVSDTTMLNSSMGITSEERARLEDLKDKFKGIWWDEAYPGAAIDKDKGECTLEEFNVLAEATRMGVDLARYDGRDLSRDDASFNRFFVRECEPLVRGKWSSSASRREAFKQLHHNLQRPSNFVINGKGSKNRPVRVTYRCGDFCETLPRIKGCKGNEVHAYTVTGGRAIYGDTIVFCPKFFQNKRHLKEITAGRPRTIADLGAPDLISYEQVMVHEWMHARVMGYIVSIVDIEDSSDPRIASPFKIYGMSRCRDFAWKFIQSKKGCGHVNPEVIENADNYAWYFANKYYSKLWNWEDHGAPL